MAFSCCLQREAMKSSGAQVLAPVEAINHRAKIVALFDLTYQLFDWLWLTAGVSHVASQLDSSSGFYSPYGPGRTAIFFDLTVPVDGIIQAVQGR